MPLKLRFFILLFLIWNFASAKKFYTIPDCVAIEFKDGTFWVPVTGSFDGNDSVCVKVTDKSNALYPGITKKDDEILVPNFVYFDTSTVGADHQGVCPKGLFCFESDKGVKSVGSNSNVLRTFDKKMSYAWSMWNGANCYYSYYKDVISGWDWGKSGPKQCKFVANPACDPHPFTFSVSDAEGVPRDMKISAAADEGAVAGPVDWDECPGNPTHLLRSQIFEYLFGMSESSFDTKYGADFASAFGKRDNGEYFIKNSFNNKEFGCGKIELKKLSKLEDELKIPGKYPKPTKPQPSFNVIFYEMSKPAFKGDRIFRKVADVGAMQGRIENNDAVFQLASRPNGLEGARIFRGPDFTDITHQHAVQGEEAAISAAPGGIFRMFGNVPNQYFKTGQNLGMNFFEHIPNLGDKINAEGNIFVKAN